MNNINFYKGKAMETAFLLIITLFAVYYIYKTTFRNSGCNCGSKECPTKNNRKDGDLSE